MKKHLLTLLAIIPFYTYAQQTYTWSVASGSWPSPSNWTPQRTAPAADDILEFNSSAAVTDLPTAETVGKIKIYNNAVVSFSTSGVGIITIGSAGIPAPHFGVEAGSSLHLTGVAPVALNMSSGFTGQVDGNINFIMAGHRLTATTAGAIIFSAGAVFTADAGFDGNAFGNTTAHQNSVVFQNGATYIFKDGGNPFALTAPNAVTIFNSGSIYRHQVNGVGPSVGGRTYGHLYIEANVTFAGIGSANNCTIQNDLSVSTGYFVFKPNSLGTHSGNFNIYGNILAAGTSYIEIGSANMPGAVQLLGTNQIIGGGGSGIISFDHFTINNASTVTLQRPVTASGIFTLQSGKMITGATSLFTLSATATLNTCAHDYFNLPYNNIGCDLSYIEGPVQKLGLSGGNFVFPVGMNDKLRPVAVRNATGDFTAEFVRGDPYLDISSTMGAGIHHISHLEYWNVAGTGNAIVELSYYDPNSGGVTDMDALRVVRFTGAEWEDQGVSGYLGSPGANGSIMSNTISNFGSFSLAGALGYPNNPLPASEIIFTAGIFDTRVSLVWQVAYEKLYKHYIVEKEAGYNNFVPISGEIEVQTIENQNYKHFDNYPAEGENRYRIKLVGRDNRVVYSEILTLKFAQKTGYKLYPNPAHEKILINISKTSSISKIAIVHINGSVIKWLTANNQTTATVDIHELPSGVYYLKIIQNGFSTSVPFVKY